MSHSGDQLGMEWCGDTDLYSVFDGLGCCLDWRLHSLWMYLTTCKDSIRNVYIFWYPFYGTDSIKRRWDKRIMCIDAGILHKSTNLIGLYNTASGSISGPLPNTTNTKIYLHAGINDFPLCCIWLHAAFPIRLAFSHHTSLRRAQGK